MSGKKRTGFRAGIVFMLAGVLLLGLGLAALTNTDGNCEYIFPAAPFSEDREGLKERLGELPDQLEETAWAAAVRSQGQSLSSENGGSVTATVYAVTEGYFDLRTESLLAGRLISGEDIRGEAAFAVIPEKTAQSLFPGREAVGSILIAADGEYTVIGVVRGGFRPGEADEHRIWIPSSRAGEELLGNGTVEIAASVARPEEKAVLRNTLKTWVPGGTWIDGSRLRLTAVMPLWASALLLGACLLRMLGRALIREYRRRIGEVREKLNHDYASRAAVFGLPRFLPAALGTAALGLGLWGLLRLAAEPLYVYTDWIPEIFTDPASVLTTVRTLLTGSAAGIRCMSRSAAIAEWSRSCILWGTMLGWGGACMNRFCRGEKFHKL